MLAPLPLMLAAATPVTIPPQPALTQAIAARDAELFKLLFEECDPARMADLLAADLEFYHDKDGVVTRGRQPFLDLYTKNCTARSDPGAWRSRRELVAATLIVDPVPRYGAMEAGEHLFYERKGIDGTEKLVGRARVAQVWVLEGDGKWRLSRVLSYGHLPAGR